MKFFRGEKMMRILDFRGISSRETQGMSGNARSSHRSIVVNKLRWTFRRKRWKTSSNQRKSIWSSKKAWSPRGNQTHVIGNYEFRERERKTRLIIISNGRSSWVEEARKSWRGGRGRYHRLRQIYRRAIARVIDHRDRKGNSGGAESDASRNSRGNIRECLRQNVPFDNQTERRVRLPWREPSLQEETHRYYISIISARSRNNPSIDLSS